MALCTTTIEAELEAPGFKVEVATFDWQAPHTSDHKIPHYSLSLTISPGRVPSQLRYVEDERAPGAYAELGRLFLVPAEVTLQGRAPAFRSRSVICRFERDWFEDVTGLGTGWDPSMLSACIDIADARLVELVSRLGQEAMAPGLASAKLAEGLGLTAAVDLARRLAEARARSGDASPRLLPWQMRRITTYFEGLANHAPDIDLVAELCGVSSRHLRRLFKATTNRTLHGYAADVWTAKAKQLLAETDLPLKEISAQLGFAHPGAFSVAFRRAAGVAPRTFRQQSAV